MRFFFCRFWFRCCSCLCVDELCLNSGSSSRLRLLSRFFLNVWFLGPGLMQLRCVVFKCGRELETMHNGGYQRESEMQHWVYFISFFFLFLNGFHGSLHPPAVRQRQGELGEQQPVWWKDPNMWCFVEFIALSGQHITEVYTKITLSQIFSFIRFSFFFLSQLVEIVQPPNQNSWPEVQTSAVPPVIGRALVIH